jgi:hypothetical protein
MTLLHYHIQEQKFLKELEKVEMCFLFSNGANKLHGAKLFNTQFLSGQTLTKILQSYEKQHFIRTISKTNEQTSSRNSISSADFFMPQYSDTSSISQQKEKNLSFMRPIFRGTIFVVFCASNSTQEIEKILHNSQETNCLGMIFKTKGSLQNALNFFSWYDDQEIRNSSVNPQKSWNKILNQLHQQMKMMNSLNSYAVRFYSTFSMHHEIFFHVLKHAEMRGNSKLCFSKA